MSDSELSSNGAGHERESQLFKEGLLLHQQGKLDEASQRYKTVLKRRPNQFNAMHMLGILRSQQGQHREALKLVEGALKQQPSNTAVLSNLGLVLRRMDRNQEALFVLDKVLALKPGHAETHNDRGIVLKSLKRSDEALASFDKALALKPNYTQAMNNRGVTLLDLDRLEDALNSFDTALSLTPNYAEACMNRGNALLALKRPDEALESFDRALAVKPDLAGAYNYRGNALIFLKRPAEALASYEQALSLNPDYAQAFNNRGIALRDLNRSDEALASYEAALALQPDYEFLFGKYVNSKLLLCDWQDISEHIARMEADISVNKKVADPFVTLGISSDPAINFRAAKIYADRRFPKKNTSKLDFKPNTNRKLRIGYYSADFHNHATAYLMAELFESHDTSKFELFGFSFGPNLNDDMRRRIAGAFDKFVDASRLSDHEVVELSRELGINIAIDLKGYTKDSRTGIFAERCAPIQVNYLGYPGTMGVDYIDYIIADRFVLPRENRRHFSEKVVYLPHSYQVNDSKRKISERKFTREEVGLPEASFVFCCFNNNYKILPEVFDGWMRILKAVDGSVLWLLAEDNTVIGNLRKEAEKRGVDSNRLVFAPRMVLDEHLARHQLADLFLDTLPCNAHTTASDALWAGLPILTCMGESFAGRVATSLLNVIQLPELITHTQEEYETRAIELALNPARIAEIRTKLQNEKFMTPLFNGDLFSKHIEAAFSEMYARYVAGLTAANISIDLEGVPTVDDDEADSAVDWIAVAGANHKKMDAPINSFMRIPGSFGELFDKITILEIKVARIEDTDKVQNVRRELDLLRAIEAKHRSSNDELAELVSELKQVNEDLWDIEDAIRICERRQDFGDEFISLARSVYKTNDRRAALKMQINILYGSEIVEEKSYAAQS